MGLSEDEQRFRREWFREHWEKGVAFNRHCGLRIDRWEPDGVEFFLPYSEGLSAHDGIFHGGVIASLLDTCGGGAVIAGHDFSKGSRLTTISMSIQYLNAGRGAGLRARGHATRRGRAVNFADVTIVDAQTDRLVATGHVSLNIAGERPNAPWSTPPATG
ncbi:conserved hypothetical protein [Frankia canadensis]|uniref:Thioesterase domain-containing protein n=1 Tax=Frankia canadensis TaxID=1836972 RepID=A0A2I2KU69_9ACTN|nr:PaaI family thioesterase [Frankia canadensis]SNQ49200.1 conserved hypothetical protein [Frankia canadensis]SOU56490.1 conserved hypothetical protein [Frankia canadensis]